MLLKNKLLMVRIAKVKIKLIEFLNKSEMKPTD